MDNVHSVLNFYQNSKLRLKFADIRTHYLDYRTVSPLDCTYITVICRRKMIDDAKATFISQIPQALKTDLIKRIRTHIDP